MAHKTLTFKQDSPGFHNVDKHLEPGSLVSVTMPEPRPIVNLVIEDDVPDAEAVAVEHFESMGYVLVQPNPLHESVEGAAATLMANLADIANDQSSDTVEEKLQKVACVALALAYRGGL